MKRARWVTRAALTAGMASAMVLAVVASAGAIELPEQANYNATTHGPDGRVLSPRTVSQYEVDRAAPWAVGEYDGVALTADAADRTTYPNVHAIYMYPKDKPSRFSQFAAMFQADARDASRFLHGKSIRWDERLAGGVNYLDISVFRSKSSSATLGGSNQFSLVTRELGRVFKDPNKKYVVWLDAPSQYCGQASLYDHPVRSAANYNDRSTFALVYRPYDDDAWGGFCRGRTLMHELGHAFGALQPSAPNQFDGAHCDDHWEDVMCYKKAVTDNPDNATLTDTIDGVFDYGSNDYWDPALAGGTGKLSYWTANLSRFLCPTNTTCHLAANPQY